MLSKRHTITFIKTSKGDPLDVYDGLGMLTSSALSRSGTISFASVRAADRQNRFAAKYEIMARECEFSRIALDHTFERSINCGKVQMPFTSLVSKTPLARKAHSTVDARVSNSLRRPQSPRWRNNLGGSSRIDETPKKEKVRTSTEDNLSFDIRPALSSSAASDDGHVMPELHPSDLDISGDEEEELAQKDEESNADSDGSQPKQFNTKILGVREQLESISSSLKANSQSDIASREQSKLSDDDIGHSVSGEFTPMTVNSFSEDEEEDDIPKPKITKPT